MAARALTRSIALPGATILGLGSILGTGVFVSIGLAAGVAGQWVILATGVAALLAAANALSSAQLAAAHPVSGGTYEYGYRLLNPTLGFIAGWLFLCAKCASAAAAALGCASYTLGVLLIDTPMVRVPVAVVLTALLTATVLLGLRRSSALNAVIVTITLLSLACLVITAIGTTHAPAATDGHITDSAPLPPFGFLEASALMFVAYTGYGRIATMGEEVRDPQRTIPMAIIATLVVSAVVYISVATVAVRVLGAESLAASTLATGAPLQAVALAIGTKWLVPLLAIGAMTAMLGVLLNLILGVSRVVLAMGRRRDLPVMFASVNESGQAPVPATITVGVVIAIIAAFGTIEYAWSLSAFTVLIYYAITNLCALRLPAAARLYPRWITWLGLAGCLGLAWWVEPRAWVTGCTLLLLGLLVRLVVRRFGR